jgi:hypothetical protein
MVATIDRQGGLIGKFVLHGQLGLSHHHLCRVHGSLQPMRPAPRPRLLSVVAGLSFRIAKSERLISNQMVCENSRIKNKHLLIEILI